MAPSSLHWLLVVSSCTLLFACHVSAASTQDDDVSPEEFDYNFYAYKHLNITNDLCGTQLIIKCASGDDDLGEHVLQYHQWFEWRFKVNWLRTTLFYCKMDWDGRHYLIDVFDSPRDILKCQSKCWWSIQKDGAYMFDQNTDTYEMVYKW